MCSTDALCEFAFSVGEATKGFNPVYPITGLSGVNICHQSDRDVAGTGNAPVVVLGTLTPSTTDDGLLLMPLEFSAE